ncbi:hypothetical protein FJT64_019473 [Amphibalanus amphitrite]|uniref:Uncharacterized protein n=1 Tax=Amphibalanus amphitrite TaxID=1232801 RepID=A0A6A4WZY6_AMPAM|nr:hypothetical protein FJT64_019473 [Amphibalanus amphitrite]
MYIFCQEKPRSSVSSDETKRQRFRARSASPDRQSRERSADRSPEKSTEKPKKKGWLSATLSRLDLRKSSDEKRRSNSPKRRGSHSPDPRGGSFSPDRPLEMNRTSTERRERRTTSSGHGTISRRRDGRSVSRDSHGTSDERAQLSSDRERAPRRSRERRSDSREPRRHPPAEKRDSNRSSDRESRYQSDTQERRTSRNTAERHTRRRDERSSGGGRPASRSASFSRRYPGEDEVDSGRSGTGRTTTQPAAECGRHRPAARAAQLAQCHLVPEQQR